MDFVTTSLDALLQKATNPQSPKVHLPAVEAFSALINKEKDGPQIAVKLIATRIHSQDETEMMHTLQVLEMCMSRCGSSFQSEVGKFRFLNEIIKLVSPKYLGSHTPLEVKQRILQLMYIWTLDYPKETKIKEAYEMLKKQGVVKEVPSLSISNDSVTLPKRQINSVFQDEENSKLLQYLLQSKNPEDLQAANRLIKNMVKEDDKRAELKSKRISELEAVNNNVRLLHEMLDSYQPESSSQDELDLIKELRQSCDKLKSYMHKLAVETPKGDMLGLILQANDDLAKLFDKYDEVIVRGNINAHQMQNESLLDLEVTGLQSNTTKKSHSLINNSHTDIDELCDIFNSASGPRDFINTKDILKPLVANKNDITEKTCGNCGTSSNHLKVFEELNILGEELLKANLQVKTVADNSKPEKISLNELSKQSNSRTKPSENEPLILDLDVSCLQETSVKDPLGATNENSNQDDLLVDITQEKPSDSNILEAVMIQATKDNTSFSAVKNEPSVIHEPSKETPKPKLDIKLSDIHVALESINPSSVLPLTVLDDKNGVTVTLHFARDKPKEGVNVIVVTTSSKNELPLSNFLFQAVVPKGCKLKLQSASATELPAYNPFLPPAIITQIMLIANPDNILISLKFIISYVMDGETITEMGEVDSLPVH